MLGNFSPESLCGLAEGEITIANVLNDTGYDTHMIGKVGFTFKHCIALLLKPLNAPPPPSLYSLCIPTQWHLGHHAPYHPTFRGFQSFYGLPYSGDMGCIDRFGASRRSKARLLGSEPPATL